MRWTALILMLGTLVLAPAAGVKDALRQTSGSPPGRKIDPRGLEFNGNLVFFYYKNLAAAQAFYEGVLGFPRVLDYEFATIHRISESSFIGLVDEARGMHKSTEPKTVTLAMITDEVNGWFAYLTGKGVTMRSPLRNATRHPTQGFVATDPEGYFLEFENFLDQPQNAKLRASLDGVKAIHPATGEGAPVKTTRPGDLGVRGTVFWLYYNDVPAAQKFYEDTLGRRLLVDQGFAKVYSSSRSGFIGLVDQSQGLHRFSETKSVNVVFQTPHLDAWLELMKKQGVPIKAPLNNEKEGGLVRAFVALDPAGYFIELHWFRPDSKNEAMLKILNQ